MKRTLLLQVCILLAMAAAAFGSCSAPQNAIEAENCNTGTTGWEVGGLGDLTIQGFSTDVSVNAGQTINFKISTPATSYHIDIYRMGYYQGNGGRYITTIQPTATLPQTQPACLTDPTTQLYDCGNWGISASWAVPSTAVSGIYIAAPVRNDTGGASQIVFVVRNDSSHSAVLFQTSDETWQAYNGYGGHSVYGPTNDWDLTNRAFKVSYNRPSDTRTFAQEAATWVFGEEYPMVRWLEANAYDVAYFTGLDAARNGSLIQNHKLYLSVGHDEYWSGPHRTNVEAARDAGVNLAFFSGNEVFWKTRWENSIDGTNTPYRTLVCYKETVGPNSVPPATAAVDPLDPPTWTGTWRDTSKSPPADGGRPENSLTGTIFMVNGTGADNPGTLSIQVPAADGKMRFWRNTTIASLAAGQTATLPPATLGYEWDEDMDNGARPAGTFDVSSATYNLTTDLLLDQGGTYGAGAATHQMTIHRAPSGALVFGAGTIQWSWGLDSSHDNPFQGSNEPADLDMQQATANLFADMNVFPATPQSGLVMPSKSTDTEAPASTITSPASGATILFGIPTTITGTAVDFGGGVVGGVEVSTDGGQTWHPATGRESWSYAWTPLTAGSLNILSRAVDDSANLETPSSGIGVTVPKLPISVDSQVSADSTTASSTIQSPAFSTSTGGELMLAFISADYLSGTNTTVTSVTGGDLSWSLVVRSNGQSGDSEIWRAFATSPLNSATVTAALSQSVLASITVKSFEGVNTTGTNGSGAIGATASKNAATGAPSASVTTTQAYSWVFGVGNDYSKALPRTPGTGQSIIHQDLTPTGDTYWVQMQNSPTYVAGTSVPINDTAPTSDSWNLAVVEVLPAPTGTLTISGTISPVSAGAGASVALTGTVSAVVTANASGVFSFGSLPNGSYTVTPSQTGFEFSPSTQSITLSGTSATGVNFTGAQIFTISGTVSPSTSGSGTLLTLSGAHSATTPADGSGNYSFPSLVNGAYTVTPSKTGFTFAPTSQPVTINGANVTGVNFTATAQGFSISGSVSSAGANATVALSGTSDASTTADASGNYTFSGLANGSYTITPSKSGYTFTPASQPTTVSGANVTGVNFTATAQGFSISGSVSSAGANATVALSGASAASTTADASGNYTFNGLSNGSYTITPSKLGYTFTPASQPATVSGANVTGVNFTAQVVVSVSLATDAKVSKDGTAASTSIASTAFSTLSGNELLLAFISTDYLGGTNTTVTGVTGGGLTWTLVVRTNAQDGGAEIWRAFAPAPLTNVTVTATLSQSVLSSITVISFTGADATGTGGSGAIGATASKSAASGAPTATVVTTRNNSWVFGVGNDYDKAIARTVGANQTLVHQDLTSAGDTYWVQMETSPTPAGGTSVTINDTAPTTDDYNLSVVEVLPALGAYGISGSITPATTGATVTLTGSVNASTTSDGSGNYSFTGLSNGSYTVTPTESGITFTPSSEPLAINGSSVTGVNFSASGTVLSVSPAATSMTAALGGSNPQPATVNVSNTGIGTLTFTTTSDSAWLTVSPGGTLTAPQTLQASASITGLATGTYTGHITVTSTGAQGSPAVVTVTLTVTAAPTWTIAGSLSTGGSGASVALSGTATTSVTADSNGNYSFAGLANGSYTVTPTKAGYTFSPVNQSVTVNGANVSGVNFTATQNVGSGLVIDAKISKDTTTKSTTLASAAFSTTSANELVLAFISTDYLSGTNTTVTGITGGGLTWTLVVRTNVQSGSSEIWRAFATAPLTNVTATATLSQSVVASITVISFTGVDTTGTNGSGAIGATASANAKTGAPTATLVTTRNNSWVFGVGNDYDNAITRTPGTPQTVVHQDLTSTGDTYWVQMQNSPTALSGTSVTINDTAPTTDRYNLSIVEVRTP